MWQMKQNKRNSSVTRPVLTVYPLGKDQGLFNALPLHWAPKRLSLHHTWTWWRVPYLDESNPTEAYCSCGVWMQKHKWNIANYVHFYDISKLEVVCCWFLCVFLCVSVFQWQNLQIYQTGYTWPTWTDVFRQEVTTVLLPPSPMSALCQFQLHHFPFY